MYSNDGETWIKANYDPLPSDVIYENGVFVITGSKSGSYGDDDGIIYSNDGINWSNIVNTNPPIRLDCLSTNRNSIAYDGSKFTMVGYSSELGNHKILTSQNGADWEVFNNPYEISSICFADGKYVGIGFKRYIYTSNDGINWDYKTKVSLDHRDSILHEGNKYFIVGEEHGNLFVSDNGDKWYQVNIEKEVNFESIAYDGNQYVAIGFENEGSKSLIYNSSDGVKWTLQKELSNNLSKEVSKIIWDGNSFIVSDEDGFSIGVPEYESSEQTQAYDKNVKRNAENIILQIGERSKDTMSVTLCDVRTSSIGLDSLNIKNIKDAKNALLKIDNAIAIISSHSSRMGAYQNSLEYISNNVENYNQNIIYSESRIRDLDIAKEIMIYTKNNILAKASEAVVSHANQQKNQILKLLK
ncbi:flagellin [Anaerovorax odorimutans]|uniref:flagellin n=1 Tax=Anaerovorax odorimutans TaxID=109327 RepID=UPI002E8E263F|nr:flagellin [Anaerovorax odorimutans]